MDRKKLLRDFYEQFFNQHDVSCAEKYVKEDYIQHNPNVPDGRESLMQAFAERFREDPDFHVEIQDILLDGDLAAVRLHNIAADGHVRAWVGDFYRFEGDMLAEHWDILQYFG